MFPAEFVRLPASHRHGHTDVASGAMGADDRLSVANGTHLRHQSKRCPGGSCCRKLSDALAETYERCVVGSQLTNGRPRPFSVMWQNIRCSIWFHLLVPGGKWHTLIFSPSSSANSCRHTFHNRERLPLLPPESAVTSNSLASG